MVVASVPEAQVDLTTEIVSKQPAVGNRARAPSPPAHTHPPLPRYILLDPRCYGYFLVLFVIVPLYIYFALPRFAKRHVLYLLLCSTISSVTVVSSRAFSSILTDRSARRGGLDLARPVLRVPHHHRHGDLVHLLPQQGDAALQNNEVVPVYYTTFTLASVSAGALVHSEPSASRRRRSTSLPGCATTFVGVTASPAPTARARARLPPPSHEMGGQEGRFNRLMEINPAQRRRRRRGATRRAAAARRAHPRGVVGAQPAARPAGADGRDGAVGARPRADVGAPICERAARGCRSRSSDETISQVIHHIAPSLSSVGMRNRSTSDANRSRRATPRARALPRRSPTPRRARLRPAATERDADAVRVGGSSGGDGIPFGVQPDDGGAGVGATPPTSGARRWRRRRPPASRRSRRRPRPLPADTPMDAATQAEAPPRPHPRWIEVLCAMERVCGRYKWFAYRSSPGARLA